jgi:hypothetical protein
MRKQKMAIIFALTLSTCGQFGNYKYDEEKIVMDSETGITLASQINSLCELTGLMLIKPAYECHKIKDRGYTVYYCETSLEISSKNLQYYILMDKNMRVVEFMPLRESFLKNWKTEPGKYELPSEYVRKQVIESVEKFNEILGNKYFGKGVVYDTGSFYAARFDALSEEELDSEKYGPPLDPFITYYLTKDLKVFGVRCGGWCYPQMDREGLRE